MARITLIIYKTKERSFLREKMPPKLSRDIHFWGTILSFLKLSMISRKVLFKIESPFVRANTMHKEAFVNA